MSLTLTYKNEYGMVVMKGGGNTSPIRVTAIEGLGIVTREYVVATYTGYDGQDTLTSRAVSRSITLAVEICSKDAPKIMRNTLDVFSREGYLYIQDGKLNRRIKCNQVQCPDITRVLRGQISTFAIQFVCDNPYFEDAEDTNEPLYQRVKLLQTPFTLDTMFGDIVIGSTICITGTVPVEPIISLYFPETQETAENITIKNQTIGVSISLIYAPQANDTVTIDIKNRKIISSVNGNLINYLSPDTFLGDFVLVRGLNTLSVDMGIVSSGFTIKCKYNNLYGEAVIV